MIKGLYVITDEVLRPGRTHTMIAQAALEGGARLIQMRDKSISDRAFFESAMEIRRLCKDAGALFFVNDRIHIAAAVGADGVNIGQSDLPIDAVRKILGDKAIIGVSCDCVEQAMEAQNDGADYIGYGPVFATSTKLDTGPVSGLDILKCVCRDIKVPVVAIGGIDRTNIDQIAASGTASAAVISAVVCADDMKSATSELIRRYEAKRPK